MMDLDKDRKVQRRTVREKGPLTKAAEDFAGEKAAMKRTQMEEGEVKRSAGMGSSKNVSAGTGRGTTTFKSDQTFKEAFAEARAEGKDTFTWKGKKYTTEMAGEKKPKAELNPEKFDSFKPPKVEAMEDEEGRPLGVTTEFKRGGVVKSSASKRADGCAQRGKTKGKMV